MFAETTRHQITILKNGRKTHATIEVIRRSDGVSFRTCCAGRDITANTINGLIMSILATGIGIVPSELSDVMQAAYPVSG